VKELRMGDKHNNSCKIVKKSGYGRYSAEVHQNSLDERKREKETPSIHPKKMGLRNNWE